MDGTDNHESSRTITALTHDLPLAATEDTRPYPHDHPGLPHAEIPASTLDEVMAAVPRPARLGCRVSFLTFDTAVDGTLIIEVQLTLPSGWTAVAKLNEQNCTLLAEDGSTWDVHELATEVRPSAPEDFVDFVAELHSQLTTALGRLSAPLLTTLTASLTRVLNEHSGADDLAGR